MFSRKHQVSFVISFIVSNSIFNCTCINFRNQKSIQNSRDAELTFTQLAEKYGYLTDKHLIVTEDGYILKIFRIQARHCRNRRGRPLLLMHGLLMSSEAFLDAGPGCGLGYVLADACHDVWVGNSRGTYNSRSHVTLDPDQDGQFWHFCSDEMGLYDQPATIDYILEHTGYEKLNYVGFSQGAAVIFIMCSERPSYCDKVNIFIALSPSSRHLHTKSWYFKTSCINFNRYERFYSRIGVHEVLRKSLTSLDILSMVCQINIETETVCRSFLSLTDSYHSKSIARSTVKNLYGHFAAGTSVHNMARFGQAMVADDLRKFDYGADNFRIYGSRYPPKYNLSATTIPMLVIYGKNDGIVDPKDVQWLVRQLPNVVEAWVVPDPKWNHWDTIYSQYANSLVHPKILDYLHRFG